jgi:hypothetical protein
LLANFFVGVTLDSQANNRYLFVVGFDAAQALAEIAKLNKAFESFGGNVDLLAQKLRAFNTSSRTTEGATNKLASAFNSNMSESAESVGRLTTSVKLMSRIVFTQCIIQQLRVLKDTFQDTAKSAADFQRKIAEISTIALPAFAPVFKIPVPIFDFGLVTTSFQVISRKFNTSASDSPTQINFDIEPNHRCSDRAAH